MCVYSIVYENKYGDPRERLQSSDDTLDAESQESGERAVEPWRAMLGISSASVGSYCSGLNHVEDKPLGRFAG